MDRRQRPNRDGKSPRQKGTQSRSVSFHMRQFQRQWYCTWYLGFFYAQTFGLDLDDVEDHVPDHVWPHRAEWLIQFVTGRPFWNLPFCNALARIVVRSVAGSVGYSRLILSAFGIIGREVGIQIDNTAMAHCIMLSEAEEAIPQDETRPCPSAPAASVSSVDQFITPFLECAPVSPFRVGDLQTLGMPSGSANPFMSDTLVTGLHPPGLCQLCDRIRPRLPSPDCLTYLDKVAIFLIHRRQ